MTVMILIAISSICASLVYGMLVFVVATSIGNLLKNQALVSVIFIGILLFTIAIIIFKFMMPFI